jgi:hypothetical protein
MEPSGIARNFSELTGGRLPADVENNPMHSRDVIDKKEIFSDVQSGRNEVARGAGWGIP